MQGPATPQRFAAHSEAETGDRPGFQPGVDLSLSAGISARDVLIHFFLRWWVVGFLTWLCIFPLSLVLSFGSADTTTTDTGFGTTTTSSSGFNFAGGFLVAVGIPFIVAWASLFIPLRLGNSQFSQLLDGWAGGAESAYGNIYQAARARGFTATILGRRIAAEVGSPPRNYLVFQRDHMQIWVLVMASGVDLWVAWTAWVRHLPVQMPYYFAKQRIQGLIVKGSDFHEALRLNELKAVQWAVHASVVDGVDATLGGQQTTIVEAFGYELPLETPGSSGASVPVHVPVPVPVPVPTPSPVPPPTASGPIPAPSSVPVPPPAPPATAPPTTAPTTAPIAPAAAQAGVCTQCGAVLLESHKFCKICGQPANEHA